MHKPMSVPQKSKDFKGSIKRLFNSLNNWKYFLILSLGLAMISAILYLIAPNKLSVLRIILIPFMMFFYLASFIPNGIGKIIALVIFVVANAVYFFYRYAHHRNVSAFYRGKQFLR